MGLNVAIVGEGDVNRGALAARRALKADGHHVELRRAHNPTADGSHPAPAAVVLAASDAALLALAERPPPNAALTFPPEAVARVLDKPTLSETATALGIATPRILPDDYTGRAVVKARSHGPGDRQEAVVTDHPQSVMADFANPFLQEVVEGPLTALTIVTAPDGTLLGHVFQRAIHVWPRPAGVSCRAVTESADPALVDAVARLCKELGWWGVAQTQFVDGRLIDLNPRLYGSLGLALEAGLDVPGLLVAIAAGEQPQPTGEGRPGVRYSWLEGDLRRAGTDPTDIVEALAFARGAVAAVPHGTAFADLAKRAVRKAIKAVRR